MTNASIARRFRRAALVGALLLGAGATAGCSKTTTYSWVDVHVTIDPSIPAPDLQALVVACEIKVTGADNFAGVPLPSCMNGVSDRNLGTFEWSTTEGSGDLQFTVTLFALNRQPFAVGTSEPVAIVPGKRISSSVLVLAVQTDGGVGEDAGTGGTIGGGGASGNGGAAGNGGASGNGGESGNGGAAGTAGTNGTAGAGGGTAGSLGTAGSAGTAGAGGRGGTAGVGGRGGNSGTAGAGGTAGSAGGHGGAGGA
jgi:hypothetical protein